MIYLILKISLYLILAALVGVAVGWFLKQIAAKEKEEKLRRDLNATRSRIPQLETNIRNREQQTARLQLEIEEWQGKLPPLQASVEEKDRLVLERDRTISALQSELSILKQQTPQSSDPLFGGEELDLSGESEVNLEFSTNPAPAPAAESDSMSELREALESRERELQQQTSELHDKQSELDALSLDMAQMTESLAERDKLITELDADVTRRQQLGNDQSAEPQESAKREVPPEREQELKDLERRLQQQREDFDSVTRVLDDQNARVQELTREAQVRDEEVQTLSSELEKAREALQEGNTTREAQEEQVQSLEQRLQEQSSAMAESLAGYSEKIDALKAERDESVAALEELSTKLNNSQDLTRKLAADLKESIRARELLSGQEKSNRQRLQEMSDTRAQLETVRKQCQNYEQNVLELEQSLELQEQRQSALVADYDDRLASLNAEKGELISHREALQHQLEGIQQQLESTRDINRSLSAELSTLQQNQAGLLDQRADFDERAQEVERLRVELQQAESARDIRDQHIRELEKRIQEQTESMAEVLNGHTDKVTALSQLNAEREATLAGLKDQVENLEQLNRDMQGELEQSRLNKQSAEEDIARLGEQLAQQNALMEDLQSQRDRSEQASAARVAELETCIVDLESSIADKATAIDELTETLSHMREGSDARLVELDQQIQSKDEEIQSLEQSLTAQIAITEEEKSRLSEQLVQQNALLEDLQTRHDQTEQASVTRVAELETCVADLESSIAEKAAAIDELTDSLSHMREGSDARLVELDQQIQSKDDQIQSLEQALAAQVSLAEEEKASLSQQLNTLSGEIREKEVLSRQLVDKEQEIDGLAEQLKQRSQALEEAIQAQKNELAQRDSLLQKKNQDLESALARLDHMQEDSRRFAGVASEVEQLRSLVDELRSQQKEHELESVMLQEELAKLEASLAEKNKALDNLQHQQERNSEAVVPLVQAVRVGGGPLSDHEDFGDDVGGGKQQLLELQRALDQAEQEHLKLQKERQRQEKTLLILNQQLEDARLTNQRLATDRAKWKKAAQNVQSSEPVEDVNEQEKAPEGLKKPSCLMSEPPVQIDDLKQIKGIGKALEKSLHQLGLYQFAQLVELGDEDIQWIDAHLERFRGRIIRDDWVAQANKLHSNGH